MICPFCGQENPDDVETCSFCGGTLPVYAEGEVPPSPEPAKPAEEPQEPPAEITGPAAETQPPAVEALPTPTERLDSHLPQVPPPSPPSGGLYGNRLWWIVGCVVFVFIVLACIAIVLGLFRAGQSAGWFNPSTVTPHPSTTELVVSTRAPTLIPASTSAAEPTQKTSQGLIFFDDFSDPNSGWDRVTDSEYSTDYYQGAYRIIVNSASYDSWANPGNQTFSDVAIEVEATKNGGTDDNDFGLICRYVDLDRFYYALISSDGYFGISKATAEKSQVLGRDNLEYSDLIKQSSATNTIRFECVGQQLSLYVNGQLLDQQTDSEYSSGNVGLIAGTYDTPGTDILFDNFSVYSP